MKKMVSTFIIASLFFNTAIFSMEDLTKSTVQVQNMGFVNIYKKIKEKSEKDNLNPLIFHLTDEEYALWEGLIKIIFTNQNFTSADLMWVIEQVSVPNAKISKDQANYLLDTIILNPLKGEAHSKNFNNKNMEKIILSLLTSPYTPKGSSYSTDGIWNKWVQGKQVLTINVISMASDLGFVDALEKIFNNARTIKALFTEISCKQRTWPKYLSKEFDDKYFDYIDWLIRNDHPSPKKAITIAQKLCEASLAEGKKISGRIVGLLAWLEQKNSFPETMEWGYILEHLTEFYGLDTRLLSKEQKEKLLGILTGKNLYITGQLLLDIS